MRALPCDEAQEACHHRPTAHRQLGGGLFKIRAKGREGIARSVFCTRKGQEIDILMAVIKKGTRYPHATWKRRVSACMEEVQDNG